MLVCQLADLCSQLSFLRLDLGLVTKARTSHPYQLTGSALG
jgi:hypothetical protein